MCCMFAMKYSWMWRNMDYATFDWKQKKVCQRINYGCIKSKSKDMICVEGESPYEFESRHPNILMPNW